jgi:hypothetical protein
MRAAAAIDNAAMRLELLDMATVFQRMADPGTAVATSLRDVQPRRRLSASSASRDLCTRDRSRTGVLNLFRFFGLDPARSAAFFRHGQTVALFPHPFHLRYMRSQSEWRTASILFLNVAAVNGFTI